MSSLLSESALVRILIDDQEGHHPVGAGFPVTSQHILTCAHVINDTLERDRYTAQQPDIEVLLDFPLLTNRPLLRAKVLHWFPVQDDSSIGEIEDIAVLELLPDNSLPAEVRPLPLVMPEEQSFFGQRVRMYGFPKGKDRGAWMHGVLHGLTAGGQVEIRCREHFSSPGDELPQYSISELREQYAMLTEKLSRLEKDHILETRAEERFSLEHRIKETRTERDIIAQRFTLLLDRQAGETSNDRHFVPGFSGTPAWVVAENAVCGMIVHRFDRVYGTTLSMIPTAVLMQAFPELERFSRPLNPYRGLEVFREKDAQVYFGRESDAVELRKKVVQQPFTAVIGASGSGKSSLVLAGVLPVLRGTGDWLIAACRPKKQPFYELASCLVPMLYDDELELIKKTRQCAADLSAGELPLSDLIRRIVQKKGAHRFLLVVDQFEELYTLNDDNESKYFIDRLLEAGETERSYVVITMRADFLETALHYGAFAEALKKALFIVPPISEDGLREAVEKPAERLKVTFESGLIDLIIRDVGREPGSLPLLEFCLTQLWERQVFRRITHDAYKAIGGVQQALANHADAVYAGFYGEDWERIRQVFLKLVRPGQGTEDIRQMAPLDQFLPEQRRVIKQLADHRLIVTGRDAKTEQNTVEVVHEALIRRWQTLQQWIEEERNFLVWREKLKILIKLWQDSGNDNSALMRGVPLNDALKWLVSHEEYLGDHERKFIKLSEHFELLLYEQEANKDLLAESERYSTLGQVAAQLTHNIRNPITSIGGSARLLSRKAKDPQQLKILDMMTMEVARIEKCLEDLFNFVDTMPFKKEEILVYPLIIKTLMLFYYSMEKQGIKYRTIVPEQLTCELDSRQMGRVLVHLVRNAVEAMENGGNLEIEVAKDAEYIRIAVRDSGTGIAEADLQRISDPFYTTKEDGTGMGLALVERVIKDHQGKLNIRCRESGGTEVIVSLPL